MQVMPGVQLDIKESREGHVQEFIRYRKERMVNCKEIDCKGVGSRGLSFRQLSLKEEVSMVWKPAWQAVGSRILNSEV